MRTRSSPTSVLSPPDPGAEPRSRRRAQLLPASRFPSFPDVEVDVDELNQEQVADLNKQATTYGMAEGDFVR